MRKIEEGLLPAPTQLGLITLRHTDAEWSNDLSDLPESCREGKWQMTKPREVVRRLAAFERDSGWRLPVIAI